MRRFACFCVVLLCVRVRFTEMLKWKLNQVFGEDPSAVNEGTERRVCACAARACVRDVYFACVCCVFVCVACPLRVCGVVRVHSQLLTRDDLCGCL